MSNVPCSRSPRRSARGSPVPASSAARIGDDPVPVAGQRGQPPRQAPRPRRASRAPHRGRRSRSRRRAHRWNTSEVTNPAIPGLGDRRDSPSRCSARSAPAPARRSARRIAPDSEPGVGGERVEEDDVRRLVFWRRPGQAPGHVRRRPDHGDHTRAPERLGEPLAVEADARGVTTTNKAEGTTNRPGAGPRNRSRSSTRPHNHAPPRLPTQA